MQIKGPGVITGYASGGRPGAFSADGWLDTGDLGHLDGDGYLFLAGWADDVINRGGEKIYPREIEEFLLTQPGVRSVAVVGVRDDVLGEYPVAYVVRRTPAARPPGRPLTSDGPPPSWPMRYARRARPPCPSPRGPPPSAWSQSLPLGATGKVARSRLRELAAAHG